MLIEVKPEQVEYLRALLQIEGYDAETESRHIDGDVNHAHDLIDMLTARVMGTGAMPVAYVAEIEGFDGLYLFEREEDRDAFVEARSLDWPHAENYISLGECPLNDAKSAGELISIEKREHAANELTEHGWPSVAADVEKGVEAGVILERLREIGEDASEAVEIVTGLVD